MNNTIRAWKDPAFRASLDDGDRSVLQDSPVGAVADVDSDLLDIQGGGDRAPTFYTCFTCTWMGCNCGSCYCTWPFC